MSEPETVLTVLGASLGVLVTVTKRRHLYRWQSVRIHLDDLDQLGSFIELEAVAPADSDLSYEHRLVAQLRAAFGLKDELLLANGYADQLLARRGENAYAGGWSA